MEVYNDGDIERSIHLDEKVMSRVDYVCDRAMRAIRELMHCNPENRFFGKLYYNRRDMRSRRVDFRAFTGCY